MPPGVFAGPFLWISTCLLTNKCIDSSLQSCHTATGTRMPYGITQCYPPPDRGDIPTLTPAEAGTRLSDPGGMQGWVDLGPTVHAMWPKSLKENPPLYCTRLSWRNYCDERVCLSASISQKLHIRGLHHFCGCHLGYGCGSFLPWQCWDTVCTSGFYGWRHVCTWRQGIGDSCPCGNAKNLDHGSILRNFSGCTIFRGPPLSSLPSPPLRSRSLRSRAPWIQLGGLGERCKLPQWGLGRSPSGQRFWCYLST